MIICAALKVTVENKKVPIIIHGLRHGDCYRQAKLMNVPTNNENTVEGFVDNNGNFKDRSEALKHVLDIGQISPSAIILKHRECEMELYTEDLY